MKNEFVHFPSRQSRMNYVADRYGKVLNGKILDVGCDEGHLRTLLTGCNYTGIDSGGTPDIRMNLEKESHLPFDNDTFDCVLCIEVLEHLDNLHEMFDELVRVARRNLIISLPNGWCNARKPIERGKGSFSHYGLPGEKPKDRHKWFFSLSEAKEFIEYQASKHGMGIAEMHTTEKPRPAIVRFARKLRYPSTERYANRFTNTLWTHFTKSDRR